MPRLTIPEPFRAGVAALAAMQDAVFVDFLAAIEGGVSAENADDASVELRKRSNLLRDQSGLSEIVSAVASMQETYQKAHDVDPETFGKDVADALSLQAPSLAKKIAPSVLVDRATKIAEAKSIELIEEKVRSLQGEVERAYCCGRILTDVRAVFPENPAVTPTAMTLLHNLRIGYVDDALKHREFYVTLETSDLVDLKEHIERALVKGKTLESLLAKADCRLVE